MPISIGHKIIETDSEGYLVNPNDWDEKVAEKIIERHVSEGNLPITETGWRLILFFREYYEKHMTHPSMHKLLAHRARLEDKCFSDEKSYKAYLYELFPHGPIRMLCKLAGLPNPKDEIET